MREYHANYGDEQQLWEQTALLKRWTLLQSEADNGIHLHAKIKQDAAPTFLCLHCALHIVCLHTHGSG